MAIVTGVLFGLASAVVPVLPAGAVSGPVVVTVRTGGGPLRVRSGPAVYADTGGTVPDGTPVTVSCAVRGQLVSGTRQWDRRLDGRYVSAAYVHGARVGPCPQPPAPVATMNPRQFIAAAAVHARLGRTEFGVPASVTIAQAVLESGWATSALTAADRNYFGIKCFGWPGSIAVGCRTRRTTECDPGPDGRAVCHPVDAPFRTYADAADSFRDHGLFLRSTDRFRAAFDHADDPDRFLSEICRAGYATSPTYCADLSRLIQQYGLRQFDRA